VAVALAFTIPFTFGVVLGNQEREQLLDRKAVEHFQRALAYESETYTELAIAELEAALQFKPNYEAAQIKLAELRNLSNAKNQVEPQDVAIASQLYSGATDALERGAWSDAVDLLEELRRVKSDYRPFEVTAQLVRAYVGAGQEALAGNDVDLARRRFEAALALDQNHATARTLRDRALLYFSGWQNAVLILADLYERDPNFADVKLKLRDAHLGLGDFANRQNAYCIAARELNAALALGAGPETRALANIAGLNCTQAILNPSPTPTATLDGTLTPEPEGTPLPVVPSGAFPYVARVRVRQNAQCNGTGDVRGAVLDAAGRPIPNVGIKIYNDYGYLPPYARTNEAGEYEIVLGSDRGVFNLVVVDDFGSNASDIVDVDYPGGNVQGCHITVNWERTR
jgi:hypothetical protein